MACRRKPVCHRATGRVGCNRARFPPGLEVLRTHVRPFDPVTLGSGPVQFHDVNKANPKLYEEHLNRLSQLPKETVRCAVCGHQEDRTVCYKLGQRVAECICCGHVYVNPRLIKEAARQIYDFSYWNVLQPSIGSPTLYERTQFDYDNAVAKLHRDILPHRQSGRFLDVGCSNGALVKRACEMGFDAIGLEVDEQVAAYARETFGIEVRVGVLEEQDFADGSFDVITLYDVIEHVFDPLSYVQACHRLLSPQGLLFIETLTTDSLYFKHNPVEWEGMMPIEHVHYFSQKNLVRFLSRHGFDVVECWSPHENNIVVIGAKVERGSGN